MAMVSNYVIAECLDCLDLCDMARVMSSCVVSVAEMETRSATRRSVRLSKVKPPRPRRSISEPAPVPGKAHLACPAMSGCHLNVCSNASL